MPRRKKERGRKCSDFVRSLDARTATVIPAKAGIHRVGDVRLINSEHLHEADRWSVATRRASTRRRSNLYRPCSTRGLMPCLMSGNIGAQTEGDRSTTRRLCTTMGGA